MKKFFLAAISLFLVLSALSATPCSADVPLRNWPVIMRGANDAPVRAVQLLLKAHGYSLAADGKFGQATQTALRRFQAAHGLVATGGTNNPTWEALIVPIHQGSTGPAVQAAQCDLRNAGYGVAISGVFDSRMKFAVQKFQKQTGHTPDGVIGRKTWYELVGGDDAVGD